MDGKLKSISTHITWQPLTTALETNALKIGIIKKIYESKEKLKVGNNNYVHHNYKQMTDTERDIRAAQYRQRTKTSSRNLKTMYQQIAEAIRFFFSTYLNDIVILKFADSELQKIQ